MKARDFQRSAVYAAEKIAFNCLTFSNPDFSSLQECEQFAMRIKTCAFYKLAGGWQRIKLTDGRARRGACYQPPHKASGLKPGVIKLPKDMRHKWVIVHEFAHALVQVLNPLAPAHGGCFTRVYIELVRDVLGEEAACNLENEFKIAGLKIQTKEQVLS